MAKRKNAAALFEVIHADNRYAPRKPAGWSLSNWMLRRREARAQPPTAVVEAAPAGPSLLARMMEKIPSIPRIGFTLDPERQIVRLQMSYTGALVSAFSLVVVIALAYMIGHQSPKHALPALAEQTTEDIRNGPAQADVLDIHGDVPAVAMAVEPTPAPAPRPTAQRPVTPTPTPASQGIRPSWSEPKPPTAMVETNAKRTVGLQYVVVQSYPPEEKTLAESAVQTLNEHGVLCTIEKGIPYAPTWYCVVGVTGFDRVRNVPEYDAYVAQIQQISDKFAGTSKFKKFEPKPFKWREVK